MAKSLKVVSVSVDGWEHEVLHHLPSEVDEAWAIVAILQGVLVANDCIKSFEIV